MGSAIALSYRRHRHRTAIGPTLTCKSDCRHPTLTAATSPHRRIHVVGSDPHRFDGDGNSIGWESG